MNCCRRLDAALQEGIGHFFRSMGFGVEAGMDRVAVGKELSFSPDFAPGGYSSRAQFFEVRIKLEEVIIAGRLFVLAMGLDHRQDEAHLFHCLVRELAFAEEFIPGSLEIDQKVRVVNHPHLIGVGIWHAIGNVGFSRIRWGHVATRYSVDSFSDAATSFPL